MDEKSSTKVDTAGSNGRDSDSQSPEAVAPRFGRYNAGFATIASDIVAVVLPLAALCLVAGLYSIHGDKVDKEALGHWRNGIIAFASIFPIGFAAIIGRLCYQIGRYRLEQGTTIGMLEQFNGSRTFGGAVLTQITLGTVNLLGISLILLWAISPLGTQALLRTLETRLSPIVSSASAVFKDTTMDTRLWDHMAVSSPSAAAASVFFSNAASALTTLMLMPDHIQTDTMDPWGSVKIPFFGDGYDNKTIKTPKSDWQDVVWSPSRERFSALAGVPIGDVPVGNTTMSVESGYVELNCYNVSSFFPGALDENIEWDWPTLYLGGDGAEAPKNANSSWQGLPMDRGVDGQLNPTWLLALDRFVDEIWLNRTWMEERAGLDRTEFNEDESLYNAMQSPRLFDNEPHINAGPTRLFFFANFMSGRSQMYDGISAYCDVRQKYVESRVNCERRHESSRQNCTAVAQRPSRRSHPPETISHLNFPAIWLEISNRLPFATYNGGADHAISYLNDPTTLTASDMSDAFQEINNLAFSRRLSQILNTYLLVSSANFGASITENSSWIQPSATAASVELTNLVEVYHISTLWIVLALVSSIIFLAGGIASIIFTHLSDGPEVLGYASTLVRDSKFMDLPPESSHMSSSDVSRMIKEQRVRYGYTEMTRQGQPILGVGPEDEVGRIKDQKQQVGV